MVINEAIDVIDGPVVEVLNDLWKAQLRFSRTPSASSTEESCAAWNNRGCKDGCTQIPQSSRTPLGGVLTPIRTVSHCGMSASIGSAIFLMAEATESRE